MKHIFEQKVYYSDTDAYSVVWHGSYLRWMERGRVDLLEMLGVNLVDFEAMDVAMPVTNMNVRYKASAKLNDTVIIETKIKEMSPITVTFSQTVRDKVSGRVFVQAEVSGVAVHNDGKIYRRIPEDLKAKLEKGIEKCQDLISI